jgi:hypothetical protein
MGSRQKACSKYGTGFFILDLNFVLGVELSKIGGSGNRRRAERMDNDE